MQSACYVCIWNLRVLSRSRGSVLCVLRLYLKATIFQPELRECPPRTTFALKSCDFCLEKLSRTTRGSNPRQFASNKSPPPPPQRIRRALCKFARRRSKTTSTTPISAKGCAGTAEIAKKSSVFFTSTTPISAEGRVHRSEIVKSPHLFYLDHTNLRRGLIFVECCQPYHAALRKEERNLKLLSLRTLMSIAPRQ